LTSTEASSPNWSNLAARLEQALDTLGRCRRTLALPTALVASFLLVVSPAQAADRVYWANDGFPSANRISWANIDGSGGGSLTTTGTPNGRPRGVAIDVAAGRVYWTSPVENLISFTNLEGSGGGASLNTGLATVNQPNAAAVHPAAGTIYWANENGDRISFAKLDSSGGGDLFTGAATVDVPIGPVVDPDSKRVYWANANPTNVISFANLDGTGGGNLDTTGATVNNPHGLALDPVAKRIYWANIGPTQNRVHVISYANLSGGGGGNLNTAGATVNVPVGVAIDPAARRIYWANQAGNKISFANLDGSGGRNLDTSGATLSGSRSPVLLKAPSGTGAPGITGAATTGSVLSCSPGSWAPDLLGSWLYRAPRSIAYSWTHDGAPIPGASDNTYTATAAGSYRCTASASNPAGSSSQTSVTHAVSPSASGPPPINPAPPANPVQPLLPPGFGAGTNVTMSLSTRRIRARGPVKVVVSNGNSFKVSGRLSAQTTDAAAFVVGAEARKSVTLKLSKTLRRLLERNRKLSLRLSAKVSDPAGDTRTLRKKVSLRLETA
jgi:DNA-binding beta-propeller fold protein YncE